MAIKNMTEKVNLTQQFHSADVIHLATQLIKHADHQMAKKWDLSYSQFKVLAILSVNQNASQQIVAECLDLTPAAISRLTESLVSKKLIKRHPKADNRRQNVLAITEDGRAVLDQAFAMFTTLEEKLYGDITKSDLTIFKKVLTTLLAKVNL